MPRFELHPQLAKDTILVKKLTLCQVQLMNDATYPWVILVPQRDDLREMHQLDQADQQALMAEITHVSRTMQTLFGADKMNVSALGNMVPQLHIHIIARYEGDAAWPGPVWGKVPAKAYEDAALKARIAKIKEALG